MKLVLNAVNITKDEKPKEDYSSKSWAELIEKYQTRVFYITDDDQLIFINSYSTDRIQDPMQFASQKVDAHEQVEEALLKAIAVASHGMKGL